MRAALQDAGVDPDSVDYVNAHATGTAAGDAAECAALLDVFGDRFSSGALAVSSTKGAVGHLLGAAGAVEAAFCALALFSSQTPPTLHLDAGALKGNADASKPGSQKDASRALKSRPEFPGVPPPGADLVRDANRNNQKTIVAMTNSFGFGGTNASLVFVKAPPVE
jgi:3-oxoacyl-[acyl-carrier-protein] synthase II